MLTTLLAKLAVSTIMVWQTVSQTTPMPLEGGMGNVTLAVYRPTMCNQVGTEYKVTTATFNFDGKERTVEIAREPTGVKEERSIDCNRYTLN